MSLLADDADATLHFLSKFVELTGEWAWKREAACADNPEVVLDHFFPTNTSAKTRSTRRARRVCAGCPVKAPCITDALRHESVGTWGGTTFAQRRRFVDALAKTRRGEYEAALSAATSELLEIARLASTTGSFGTASPGMWLETGAGA